MKKTMSILVILGVLLTSVIYFDEIKAATYTVCASGCDYTTIQAAINAASSNDTILVYTGSYAGFDVNKTGITVRAATGEAPVINGAGVSVNGQVVAVQVSAHNVTIQGLTIDGSYSTGIYVYNAATPPYGANILDNTIDQTGYDPGALASWDGGAIYANAGGSPPTVFSGNIIDFGSSSRAHNGIKTWGDNDPDYTIQDNTITITTMTKYQVAINVETGDGSATVENNTITSPDKTLGSWTKVFGIWLYGGGTGAKNTTVQGNTVTKTDYALWVSGPNADNIFATENNFYSSDFGSVIEGNATGVDLECNNIYSNTYYGVYNGGTVLVDAEWNWWGSLTGPSGVGPGVGDAVTDDVDYSPWLQSPCNTRPLTPPSLETIINSYRPLASNRIIKVTDLQKEA
ncbi:MAG: DUF1565 domain-containing protein, partial [Candidatus Methanofastidiosia archaeon]